MQRPPFFRPDVPKSSTNRDFSDLLEDTAKRGGPFLPVRTSERFRTEAPIGDKYLSKSFRVLNVFAISNIIRKCIEPISSDGCVQVFPLIMLSLSPSSECR